MVLLANRAMDAGNIEDLIHQISVLHLEREESLREIEGIQRHLCDGNQQESRLLRAIQIVRDNNVARDNEDHNCNPLILGERVRITNRLRNEFGTVGVVTRNEPRLVTIRNERSGRSFTRAW